MNPIAVKKLIEHRNVFSENFIFLMPSTLFSLIFPREIALFACFVL